MNTQMASLLNCFPVKLQIIPVFTFSNMDSRVLEYININESLMRYPFLAGGEWSTVVQINGNMPQEDPVTHTYIHVLVLLNPRQLLSLPTSKVAMAHQ